MARMDLSTLTIAGRRARAADLDPAIVSVRLDRPVAAGPELTLTLIDPTSALIGAGLTTADTLVTLDDVTWTVAASTETYPLNGPTQLEIDCRDPLGRALHGDYRSSVQRNVSPSAWVSQRVKDAGGKAITQPSSTLEVIAKASGDEQRSDLDVIAQLASSQGWSWVIRANRLWFMSAHHAWTTAPVGQQTWRTTAATTAATFTRDVDDTETAATGTLIVPADIAARMQPWDLAMCAGYSQLGNGSWLIGQITVENDGNVSVPISRPRPPRKKKAEK